MSTVTPNMGLTNPTVSTTVGPDYARQISADLDLLDAHDHSPNFGPPVPTSGLNINADLSFQSNDATMLRSTQYDDQTAALPSTDLRAVYAFGGNLYYNNGSGSNVQITSGSSIVGTAGSINGLPSGTAAVNYNSGSGTFQFLQATTTPANMSTGGIAIIEATAGKTNAVTLQSPTSLAASYTLIQPAALPGSTKFLTVASDGTEAFGDADGTTLQSASGVLSIKAGGVGTTELAALGVTRAKQANVGQIVSSSSGGFIGHATTFSNITNLACTNLTTSGRPIMVMCVPMTGAGLEPEFGMTDLAYDSLNKQYEGTVDLQIRVTGTATTTIGATRLQVAMPSLTAVGFPVMSWAPSSLHTLYVAAAGTYTFTAQYQLDAGGVTFRAWDMVLVAYEI